MNRDDEPATETSINSLTHIGNLDTAEETVRMAAIPHTANITNQISTEDIDDTEISFSPHEEETTALTGGLRTLKNTSSVSALMNFLKGCIGTGVLALPIAFFYTGLWIGMLIIMSVGILSTYHMHVLLRTSESLIERQGIERSKMDYTETVFNVFKYGPLRLRKYKGKFKYIANIFILLTQLGFCCIYVLFISQNLQYFAKIVSEEMHLNVYLIGLVVTLILVPLSQIRNLRILGILSALAIAATILGMTLIFTFIFSTGIQNYATFPAYKPFKETLIGLGIFIFTFEGIALTLPIRNRMMYPDRFVAHTGVLNMSMVIVISLSTLLGFFGYLRFGEYTLGSITYNIGNSPFIYTFIKPLFIFSIFVSYMLQFYVPSTIITKLLLKFRCHRDASTRRQTINRRVGRVVLVFVTYGVAMIVPHLELMVSLLGSVSSTMLALIMPPLLELVHLWPDRDQIPNFWVIVFLKHCIFVIIGICALVGGTMATCIQIIETFRDSPITV